MDTEIRCFMKPEVGDAETSFNAEKLLSLRKVPSHGRASRHDLA
jgi:hypothetical protein